MSEDEDEKASLALEDVARLALELAAERELPALLSRFLETVRLWAAPSAVVAAVRDATAESHWRLLPAVCLGSVPLGVERSLEALLDDAPECRRRPTILRPREDVPGVRPRDNCIVPWSFEDESGLLLLRGIPRPYPSNLGEALALVSAPLWPRLLGSPAARVESLVEELRRLARRLEQETTRQVERLSAARPTEPTQPPAAILDPAREETLVAEVRAARLEAERASRSQQELAERFAGLQAAAELTRSERDAARGELQALSAGIGALESEREAAHTSAERLAAARAALESERDAARAEAERLSSAQAVLEEEREAARAELQRLRTQAQSLEGQHSSVAEQTERHRLAAEEALAKARSLEEARLAAQRELDAMRTERDRARSELDRLGAQFEPLRAERAAVAAQLEEARRALESAEGRAGAAEAANAALRDEVSGARAASDRAQAHAKEITARCDGALAALGLALASLRRAAFVPPGLRLSMEDASAFVEPEGQRPAPWLQVALLDRDPVALEDLAQELEAAGLSVKIANYPEELGLLLRTPGARDLAAVVCDVVSFRPDQNVAGLFRSWEKDRPGLSYYLSYNPDNSGEIDRARRVPQSLTTGHIARPLAKARLIEAFEALARRRAQS